MVEIGLTKYWQLIKDLEVTDNISKTANDALIAISIIKGGYTPEDEAAKLRLKTKIIEAIKLMDKAAEATSTRLTKGEIPLEAYYVSYFISDRFMISDVQELKEVIQDAIKELEDFIEMKEKSVDHAIKLLQEITRITSQEREKSLIELSGV
jgi:hypothetical protein